MITARHIARMGRLVCSSTTPRDAPSYGILVLHFDLPISSNVLPSRVADGMTRRPVSESYVAIDLLTIASSLALRDIDHVRDNTVLTSLATAFEASDNGYGYR